MITEVPICPKCRTYNPWVTQERGRQVWCYECLIEIGERPSS
jgi:hypothetical protein